jgi:hypothetical protein
VTVFVGPSIWRDWNVRSAVATFAAMTSNPTDERVIFAPLWNDALIGRSRSIMCTEFLKVEDADVMVIIDDDIVFEPADFWKIVEGARETRSVYGAAYVTRSTEPHITSRAIHGTGEQIFAQTPNRRAVEYQYLATGFWAVHRDVMEAMIAGTFEDAFGGHTIPLCELGADRPFYPFFSPFVTKEEDGRIHYLSEDWAFSNRARQLGFKVWVDLSIILIHMGLYPFTVRDLKDTEPGLPSTGIDVFELQGEPAQTGEPLIDNLAEDIAEWAGDDVGDIRRSLEGEFAANTMNRLWLTRKESEEDWYKREDVGIGYIADIASWHLRGGAMPFELTRHVAGKALMDFGAGIGTWAIAAARAGAEVTAVETNPILREFIQWRAAKYGVEVEVLAEMPAGMAFHVVSCWHVYEHLSNAEDVLRAHAMALPPGGLLITDSGFNDASTACHHVRDDWDDVLARTGFELTEPHVYRVV